VNCKEFNQYITLYIDKELPYKLEGEFKEHLDNCEECKKAYTTLEEVHSKLGKLFTEKEVPIGLETRIINNLPEQKPRFSFKEVFFVKKTLAFLVPILIVGCVSIAAYTSRYGIVLPQKIEKTLYDIPAEVRVKDMAYGYSDDVITDERVIDKEIATIEIKLNGGEKIDHNSPWASTIAEPGTKVYSIKGLNEKEAIALKRDGYWQIFRVMNGIRQSQPIFTEDMLKSEKIVVTYSDNGKSEIKEITDKETIEKVAIAIKNAEKVSEPPSYYGSKYYEYYFVIRDSNGIGKIAHRYYATMQDIDFEGYIRTGGDVYKLGADFNKLITSPFGSIQSAYDEKLGGKKQINEAFIGAKVIFRSLIKEQSSSKSEIALLNEGDNIWQNGRQIKDNLKGKYKLQIIMKDTTVQKQVVEEAARQINKTPDALSINFTEGSTKDTLVIYLCFDTKPEFNSGESDNSFVIEFKK